MPLLYLRKKLENLSADTGEGRFLYQQYIVEAKRSIGSLLLEYTSISISLENFLELLSPIKPRYYSISSSPKLYQNQCHITVGKHIRITPEGNTFNGLCSDYLHSLSVGSKVNVYVREHKTEFKLPENVKTPIIMIGAGTGLAPFRGFLQELNHLRKSQEIPPCLLFYGCRHPSKDYIYREELETFEKSGLVKLFIAFSRYPNESTKNKYVQDLMMENIELLFDYIDKQKAIVYVCGAKSKLASEVYSTIIACASQNLHINEADAKKYVKQLQSSAHYLEDVWG